MHESNWGQSSRRVRNGSTMWDLSGPLSWGEASPGEGRPDHIIFTEPSARRPLKTRCTFIVVHWVFQYWQGHFKFQHHSLFKLSLFNISEDEGQEANIKAKYQLDCWELARLKFFLHRASLTTLKPQTDDWQRRTTKNNGFCSNQILKRNHLISSDQTVS